MKRKSVLWILAITTLLLVLFFSISIWHPWLVSIRANRLKKKANTFIEEIEIFRRKNSRLPESKPEMGIPEEDGPNVFYYDKLDSVRYRTFFGGDFDEIHLYYSDTKTWYDHFVNPNFNKSSK